MQSAADIRFFMRAIILHRTCQRSLLRSSVDHELESRDGEPPKHSTGASVWPGTLETGQSPSSRTRRCSCRPERGQGNGSGDTNPMARSHRVLLCRFCALGCRIGVESVGEDPLWPIFFSDVARAGRWRIFSDTALFCGQLFPKGTTLIGSER